MDDADRVLGFSMASEAKVKTGLVSIALGAAVSAITYLIARKVTDSTLGGVEVLLTELYDVQLKDQGE